NLDWRIGISLGLQAAAIIILIHRLGRAILVHVGGVFIVLATMYHGLGELLIALFPGRNPYRSLVGPDDVAATVLIISSTILLFTIVYTFLLKHDKEERILN